MHRARTRLRAAGTGTLCAHGGRARASYCVTRANCAAAESTCGLRDTHTCSFAKRRGSTIAKQRRTNDSVGTRGASVRVLARSRTRHTAARPLSFRARSDAAHRDAVDGTPPGCAVYTSPIAPSIVKHTHTPATHSLGSQRPQRHLPGLKRAWSEECEEGELEQQSRGYKPGG